MEVVIPTLSQRRCIGEASWVAGLGRAGSQCPEVNSTGLDATAATAAPPHAAGLRFICRWQTGIGALASLPGHPLPCLRQRARDAPYRQMLIDTILCERRPSFFYKLFLQGLI